MTAVVEVCTQLQPDPDEFGRSWPYVVHHTRIVEPGLRKEQLPVRNMPYADAVAYAEHLAEDPDVVEVHVSLDTCG